MRVPKSHPGQEKTNRQPLPLYSPFFKNGILIEHSNLHLEFSNCILITFKMQKKDEKNNTVMQMSFGDVNMCPVRMGAAIVHRI